MQEKSLSLIPAFLVSLESLLLCLTATAIKLLQTAEVLPILNEMCSHYDITFRVVETVFGGGELC